MKYIWNYLENTNWKAATKYKAFLLILGILSGAIGLILWGIVQIWTLQTLDWMICFIGYPVILAWISAFLFTCNHDFHDGKP